MTTTIGVAWQIVAIEVEGGTAGAGSKSGLLKPYIA